MSITYRPPFDEDDERDLRALYRKPRPGTSPELDAAVRRSWHPGHSWHPGWAAAACAAMVAGLFAWTDMRESADMQDLNAQLVAPHEVGTSAERSPAPTALTDALTDKPASPAVTQRVVAPQNDAASSQPPAAPATSEAAAPATAETAQQGDATATEVVAFSEQDIEARVAHIRSLVQDDQQDEAVQALRELQQGAPDLTLPDDLQELAQQNPA
ncbi:hypothetical protein [Achromobacter pestifer]